MLRKMGHGSTLCDKLCKRIVSLFKKNSLGKIAKNSGLSPSTVHNIEHITDSETPMKHQYVKAKSDKYC